MYKVTFQLAVVTLTYKIFVWAISWILYGVGSCYLVGTLVRGCSGASSWFDLDFTFDLAIMTLTC